MAPMPSNDARKQQHSHGAATFNVTVWIAISIAAAMLPGLALGDGSPGPGATIEGNSLNATAGGTNIVTGRDAFIEQFVTNFSFSDFVRSVREAIAALDQEIARESDATTLLQLKQRRATLWERLSDPVAAYQAAITAAAASASRIQQTADLHPQEISDANKRLILNDTKGAEDILRRSLENRRRLLARAAESAAEDAFTLAQLKENNDLDLPGAEKLYLEAVRDEPDNPTYLSAAAKIEANLGEYTESEQYYRRLINLRSDLHGTERVDLARAEQALARLYWDMGRFNDADTYFNSALEIAGAARGASDIAVASILDQIGVLRWKQGRYSQAEKKLRVALGIAKDQDTDEARLVYSSIQNSLGSLLIELNDFEEARRLLTSSLETEEALFKDHPNHPRIANVLNNLAVLWRKTERFEDAKEFNSKALAIYSTSLGEKNPAVANSLLNESVVLCRVGNYAGAMQLASSSAEMRISFFGRGNRLVAESDSVKGYIALMSGDAGTARKLFEEAYSTRLEALGSAHLYVAKSRDDLGLVDYIQAQFSSSRDKYLDALQILQKTERADDIYTPVVLLHYEKTLRASGDNAQADNIRQRRSALKGIDIDCAR
jgi:tetratricopeptide (TPR) repeat protein